MITPNMPVKLLGFDEEFTEHFQNVPDPSNFCEEISICRDRNLESQNCSHEVFQNI